MCFSVLKQYVSHSAERWTCLTCEHGLTLGTSCDCIYEEAVGRPEELPALCFCGGCLLCGYNMVGQVYCLERGCSLVLLQLWAGTRNIWRTKTLTCWKWFVEERSQTQLGLDKARNGVWKLVNVYNCIFVSAVQMLKLSDLISVKT